jgi:hypothetical protein
MWDGYLSVYVNASSGAWHTWWDQHNEHRILIGKLFFYFDLTYFRGEGWLLLGLNYIWLSVLCVAAVTAQRQEFGKDQVTLLFFTPIWLVSWAQRENLTWAFQGPFFLATLLPFVAVLTLYKSTVSRIYSVHFFVISCILGLLSVGTMANGLLILPLMAIYASIIGLSRNRILTLIGLFSLACAAFFWDYTFPSHHGSLLTNLANDPLGFLRYVFLFVGSPVFHILGCSGVARAAAEIAGLFLIISSAYSLWTCIHHIEQATLRLAMLTFVLYVGGTAFAAAGGRLQFGLDQALSSRYTTPALMAWVALSICLSPAITRLTNDNTWRLWIPLIVCSFMMVPMQLKALQSDWATLFQRELAGLALEMRIKDQKQIAHVYPSADVLLLTTERASAQNLSLFGHPRFRDIRERVGQNGFQLLRNRRTCEGFVDAFESIPGEPGYWRIHGWLRDTGPRSVIRSLWIVSYDGRITGYALRSAPRSGIFSVAETAAKTRFSGYVVTEARLEPGKLLAVDSDCSVPFQVRGHSETTDQGK